MNCSHLAAVTCSPNVSLSALTLPSLSITSLSLLRAQFITAASCKSTNSMSKQSRTGSSRIGHRCYTTQRTGLKSWADSVLLFQPKCSPHHLVPEYPKCLHYVLFFSIKIIYDLFNPYPTAFPYGNGMVLHFYKQQESSTTKTVHKVINKGLKAYV